MADNFLTFETSLDSPAEHAVAVTPDDATDLTTTSRGIYVGGSGDLKVDMVGSGTVTFTSLAAGVIHPIRADRVYSTGTTATTIVALW